jgi:type I restriction enzyme S subunit
MSAIPAGYKQTEVGVIPEDWSVKRISELATVGSGGTPSRENAAYWNGDIPWITTSQINFNTITEADQFISEVGLKNSAAKLLPAGTLLMALYGQGKTRGKVGVLGFEAATNQACASISPTGDISPEFLLHYLASRYEAIRNSSNTGSQENLNGQIVKDTPVVFPPILEQRAIAAALSDVDAMLAKLGQFIAKKRDLKQAAMQQLLTGQARLPGFGGAWEVKRLGDVCPLQRGFDLLTTRLRQGRYPVVYSNGVLNYHHEFMVKGPGVVTGRSGTIGNVHYVEKDFWPHNTSLWVTNFKGNSPRFIFYMLASLGLERFGTGSGVPTLNRNDVHAHKVRIPVASDEQTVIASVISDMDAEIATLEARRDKTRALKLGMMQELLTGRIRLV